MQGLRVRRHQAQGRQLAICCINLIDDPIFPLDVAVFRDGVRGDQQLDDDDRESWQESDNSSQCLCKNYMFSTPILLQGIRGCWTENASILSGI